MHHGRIRAGRQADGAGGRRSRALVHLCAVALASATLASCAHAVASTTVELPPLEMPEPPPRVVEVIEPEPLPVAALPEEPRTNVRSRPVQPPRPDVPRQEPPKTDPVVAETPRPADDPPKAPPTTLQTTPTQREGEVERRIRILVAQARNDLNRVNYQALNTDARNQYDMAKRFATQAEEAVRTRNLMFATNLADKAAGLAAQLLGR